MNNDLSIKQLIDLLVQNLKVDYGSIEIKVHNGKWTNYNLTERVNNNESDSKDLLRDKIRSKE